MAIYSYICKDHQDPEIIEIQQSITQNQPQAIACPKCSGKAKRLYHGQSIWGANGPTSGGKKMWRGQQELTPPQI